jgi:gliding motility-associated-like protein
MKKYTASSLFTCVILLFLAFAPTKAKASHAAGGEIIYEWISDSTYRFFFKFYRDCTGIPEPPTQSICMYNPCTNFVKNVTMQKYTGMVPPGVPNGSPVSPGCSSSIYPTKCTDPSSSLPGFTEWWYTCVEPLPGQCDAWKFTVSIGARNTQNNIVAGNFHVETTFNNLYAQGNSSPYFSIKPIPFCCINQQFTYNNGAVDPNGDSLSNEVINPMNGSTCTGTAPNAGLIAQTPPISFPTNPLQTNNSYTISATTGSMSFTPSQAGPSTMTIRTKEWRNGILIGSIMRDVQVQVLTSCNFTPPTFPPIQNTNVTGGTLVGGQIRGCVGQQLQFDYFLTSTDPDAILLGSDNHDQSCPGSNTAYTNSKTNNVKGTFTWTPSMTQTGNFSLSVNLVDSTCRPPGILYSQTFTIPIFINGPVVASKDTSVCPGDPAQLSVSGLGAGNYTWSYLSGPTGSLNSTTIPNPVASPFATTSYLVTSGLTSYCLHNKDTVVVSTLPSPTFVPVSDKTTCPGVAITLDPQVTPDPGVTYSAKWTPATYLSSNATVVTTTTPLDNITYTVVISASNTQCKGFDTVVVDVLDGYKLSTGDTAICLGESVQVTITGDPRYTYEWSTNDNSGNTSISNTAIIDPSIKPTEVGVWKYYIKASYVIDAATNKKCPDSLSEFDIDVQPVPTVVVPADAIVCFGDTMLLGADVQPNTYSKYSYTWSPGQSLNDPNKINPIFTATATTTLTMTASTPAGCKGSDDITLNVLPSDFLFLSDDTSICPGESAQINTETVGLKSFMWANAEGMKQNNVLSPVVYPTTTEVYAIYGRDTNGCYDTQMVKVTVRPRAMIDLPESVKIYPGESYQMMPGGNGISYNWFPPVGLSDASVSNPVAKPEVNTRYFVTAVTESGCIANDTIDVLVAPDSYIDMPNAFSPGTKNVLKPIRLGDATLKSFTIYNRWGQKMYESSDMNQGWDGRYKDEAQPMGVYIYTIEAVTPAGRKFTKQGNITLIR